MARKNFQFQEQVQRTWNYIDALARRAWDRDGISQEQKKAVSESAGHFFSQLLSATKDLPPSDATDISMPPFGINVDENNWEQFALNEFVDMTGRRDVWSITDAYLKATYLLGVVSNNHRGYVFRGHRDITWKLIPRKGRELAERRLGVPGSHLDDQRKTIVLDEEVTALKAFQDEWDAMGDVDDIDKARLIAPTSSEWWFRMQHYDSGNGTRMLDVTTSINAALLFACVNWGSGELDENQDGVLFLWPVGHNANTVDFLLEEMPSNYEELFTGYPDAPVFIMNPPHNERSKAQSGAFYWWPKFWEHPSTGAPYYLRIPKNAKKAIVTDLLNMGFGPKDAVRGNKGLQNEHTLRKQLGFPDWNPLALN
jgi:hypothetical protein